MTLQKNVSLHSDYNENSRCAFTECNSQAHLIGKPEIHQTISTCPLDHNTTSDEYDLRKVAKVMTVFLSMLILV